MVVTRIGHRRGYYLVVYRLGINQIPVIGSFQNMSVERLHPMKVLIAFQLILHNRTVWLNIGNISRKCRHRKCRRIPEDTHQTNYA